MSVTVVRYRVRPEHAATNESLVRDVYAELEAVAPPGFRYATFVLDDGVSFVHVASTAGDAPAPLTTLPAFRRFLADLGARCEEPPLVSPSRVVGAFGFDRA
jgi:hypothetical protein